MDYVRRFFVSLMIWLVSLGYVQAESVSTSGSPMAAIDAAIGAVFTVEQQGMRGVGAKNIARLTRVPQEDPQTLTGYTKTSLASLPSVEGGKQWQCLTEALYFEARGEAVTGQFAVAEVIMNRVASPSFPNTVCGVVHQGSGELNQCQFSFYCDGHAEVFSERDAYRQVGKVARITLSGVDLDLTDGATFYHTKGVVPSWSRVFKRTATIGYHHFYSKPSRVANAS